MEIILLLLVAFGAAMLTFFSGFGLGTILMPVFAIFFPVEVAIALTAIVHLLNNLFKLVLIWKQIVWRIAVLFALPAALAAIPGAILLNRLSSDVILYNYEIGSRSFDLSLIKLIIGILLIVFAIIEIDKRFEQYSFGKGSLPYGGLLSGFFGGLSGHQGALRSMFLIRAGLSKEGFIATGIVTAVVVDISRLSVYGTSFFGQYFAELTDDKSIVMVIISCLAAFAGSFIGRRFLKRVTFRWVQLIVGLLILVMGLSLVAGLI